MPQDTLNNKGSISDVLDLYLSKWKYIAISVFIALAFAYVKARYSVYEYQANATIKIKEDEKSNKLAELSTLQNYGMFSNSFAKVSDEIEVIKSRTIMAEVVSDLKLNIKYFVSGKVKNQEVFKNPPINVNFLMHDSIIREMNTSFHIKIISPNKFELSKSNNNKLLKFEEAESEVYSFGDKIQTAYGEIILTPNSGNYGATIDSYVEIQLRPFDYVVQSYLSAVKIATDPKSSVLKLSIVETSAEKARVVLDKLIEQYNADVVEDKDLIVKATSDFINNRLEVVSMELENVDFTAETMQKNNRLTALASQSNIYLQSERENENNIIKTSNQLQLIDYMSNHLTQNNKDSDLLPSDVGIADAGIAQITKNHNELVLQRNRLLKNSSEKNPTVINLNNQISALKSNLSQSLDNLKSANQITLNSLNLEDARISSQIYSTPGRERQFRDIKRQQDIKESLYLYLLQKREETAISHGMSSPNAKIIDKAYGVPNPVNPKKKMIFIAAFLVGLFIPVSFIYIKDLLDNKLHTKDDLTKLIKAPFIGDIPKSSNRTRLVKKVDYSPKAEAFRIVRTNANFMMQNVEANCKTIFVTSTTSQEGKSHTSINLASSFSFSEKKVLLIETDIRVPKVNDYLNITSNTGLTNYISDKSLSVKDVTMKIADNPYLDVIPSGDIPPNPAELLMNDRINTLFETVKKEYDYIIVDTAAVGLVTDTLLISKHADMFIYVVSANNIDKRQLHVAQTMYSEKRLPNMAVLLNGVLQKKGYGYGYGNNPQRKKKWYKLFK